MQCFNLKGINKYIKKEKTAGPELLWGTSLQDQQENDAEVPYSTSWWPVKQTHTACGLPPPSLGCLSWPAILFIALSSSAFHAHLLSRLLCVSEPEGDKHTTEEEEGGGRRRGGTALQSKHCVPLTGFWYGVCVPRGRPLRTRINVLRLCSCSWVKGYIWARGAAVF